jgi:hypothetical protein
MSSQYVKENMSVAKFLEIYSCCQEGVSFLKNHQTIQEAWKNINEVKWIVWAIDKRIILLENNLGQNDLRQEFLKFAKFCIETKKHLLDPLIWDNVRAAFKLEMNNLDLHQKKIKNELGEEHKKVIHKQLAKAYEVANQYGKIDSKDEKVQLHYAALYFFKLIYHEYDYLNINLGRIIELTTLSDFDSKLYTITFKHLFKFPVLEKVSIKA